MQPDIETVRAFITAEQAMRQKVFRDKPSLAQSKNAECLRALYALERIEQQLKRADELARQPSLLAWEG